MGSRIASRHDSQGSSGGFHELDEDFKLSIAGTNVWVVLSKVFLDLTAKFELFGEVPEGSEQHPKVGSEGHDHAPKRVKCLEEVKAEISSSIHNNTLYDES